MAKSITALGIELLDNETRLLLLEHTPPSGGTGPGETVVRDSRTVGVKEDLAKVLRALPRRPNAVACAITLENAAVRILNLPPTTEENLERVVSLEAESALPIELHDLAISHHVLGITEQSRMEVLLAAARHGVVQGALARVNCLPWVSASMTVTAVALLNALHQLRSPEGAGAPAAVLRVEERGSELVVLERQKVVAAQAIPVGVGAASLAPAPAPEPVAVGAGAGTYAAGTGQPAGSDPQVALLLQQARYALQALSYERGLSVDRLYVCGKGGEAVAAACQLSASPGMPDTQLLSPLAAVRGGGAEYAVAYGCALQAGGLAPVPLNLTPARVSVEREVVQRRQTRMSWAALAGAVLVSGGLVFGAAVGNKKRELEAVNARLRELGISGKSAPAPAIQPGELKAAASSVGEALETRVPAARALGVLSRTLPTGSWLAELTYNSETGCILRGYATEPTGPQRAQIALLRQQIFDEVTLDYRTEEEINRVPVWGFQISCKLRQQSARPQPGKATRGAGAARGGSGR